MWAAVFGKNQQIQTTDTFDHYFQHVISFQLQLQLIFRFNSKLIIHFFVANRKMDAFWLKEFLIGAVVLEKIRQVWITIVFHHNVQRIVSFQLKLQLNLWIYQETP